jgi:hypothetical protein
MRVGRLAKLVASTTFDVFGRRFVSRCELA